MNTEKSKDKHCDYNTFKRTRYFHGMLMTDRDFREEQIYHNEKRKLHNRMLHGWGVVCGLGLRGDRGGSTITVTPGMALDCHGNEIVVCETKDIDIAKEVCLSRSKPQTPITPEACVKMERMQEQENKWYIAIKYTEVPTDPVPVYAPGGSCEEKVCEYSRIREGFCIEIFNNQNLPYQPQIKIPCNTSLIDRLYECENGTENNGCQEKKLEEFRNLFCMEIPCPDCCPKEHFVILGSVALDDRDNIKTIMPNDRRHYVMTSHQFKYIFDSLLRGVEDWFNPEDFPEVSRLHDNPLHVLCWAIDHVLKGKKIGIKSSETKKAMRKMFEKLANKMKKLWNKAGT